MRLKRITLLSITLCLLTSCVDTNQLEKLGIIHTRGVDISEEKPSELEATLIIFQFNAQSDMISKTLTGTGHTIKEAREQANNKSSFSLTPGQIRLELYGKEIAEKGILTYLKTLTRDAKVSDTMLLAISDTTAKEILEVGQADTNMDIGQFLHGLIRQEHMKDTIPEVALHDFTHTYFDVGQDPYLPVITLDEQFPMLSALGVFQGDKYVGDITLDDALLLNMTQKHVNFAPIEVEIPKAPFKKYIENTESIEPDSEYMHIRIGVKGKTTSELTDRDQLRFRSNVDLDVDLHEISEQFTVEDNKAAKILEKELGKAIKKKYETMLNKLQELNSDPIGYGKLYRVKVNNKLTMEEWTEKFPEITVDFQVDVNLVHFGTLQ
ncbi:Ger(x)C family spore germination protein [Oceanobacillus manasiensis]|uniref:Ger(x)C family spore germination protein n=1 Tax=Oceanobacillus manasiensis TaxID=586413 RepID=UPI0005A8DE6B|nr:Ger(x)C family spore germination protein [Oceanobacillus manasiensis]